MYLTRTFRDPLFEYEFSFPWENQPYGKVMHFSDFSTTRQVLANFIIDSSAVSIFRSCLAGMSEVGPAAVSKLNDHQVIDKLSQLLVLGRVKLYRREQMFFSFQERKPIVEAISQVTTESTQSWVEVTVVWDGTGQPIPNLQLVVVSPDGQRNVKQTDSDGRLRIDPITDGICEVRCSTIGVKFEECVNFLGEGQKQAAQPSRTQQGSTTQPSSTTTQTGNPLAIALIEEHKVKTGETLASLAAKAGMTWQDLAYFNWGTKVSEEINKHLANDVGCTKKTADGKNYLFDDSDKPGIVYVPKDSFYRAGTGIKHIIRVGPVPTRELRVVDVDDFYWREMGLQYIERNRSEFDDGIWSIFGDDIPKEVIDKLCGAFRDGSFPRPKYEFVQTMPEKTLGYYRDGTIYLLEPLILEGLDLPEKRWQLFLVMAEEFGHHIDQVLRNKYSSIGKDAPGNEGMFFAADFLHFHKLMTKDFSFATFELTKQGDKAYPKKIKYEVLTSEVTNSVRRQYILDVVDPNLEDHGIVRLKDGQEVEVEFFTIRMGGAAHEKITTEAARSVGLPYDNRLDEGCAWPDVPCADEDSVETCYSKTWRDINRPGTMANRSHHGDLQYFHNMCPTGSHTNAQVLELIIAKLRAWYDRALQLTTGADFQGNGLFHLGKMCHTVQDSFSRSHTWRNTETNRVITFQDYNMQDTDKHSTADNYTSAGVPDAINATRHLMTFFRDRVAFSPNVERYLREEVYAFEPNAANKAAGGTHPDYAPDKK